MMFRTLLVAACALLGSTVSAEDAPAVSAKPPVDIKADTTWTGDVTVDSPVRIAGATLTVSAGTKVTFAAGGSVHVGGGAALVAKGTKESLVRFIGGKTGTLGCHGGSMLLEFCDVGEMDGRYWLDAAPGKDGIVIRDSTIRDCPGASINVANGPFEMSRTRVENGKEGIGCRGDGKAEFKDNTFIGCGFAMGENAEGVARGNVVIGGTLTGWRTTKLLVENNYVHQPRPAGSYGFSGVQGTVRQNVIRGGSWTSAGLGGTIEHNVFISLPHEERRKLEGGSDKNCTHEHICGLVPKSLVSRNIFVDGSYAAVLGIGAGTCSDSVIRYNTFDMRGAGYAIMLNHLPASSPKNIRIVGNLLIRSEAVQSEKPIPDSTTVIDYTLWAASGAGRGGRFDRVTMAGQTEGQGSFGGHDVPPYAKRNEPLNPADVVVNPNVEFPFSDEDMISRKHTVAEVLDVYRKAYSPKPGSAAIDAGDPADKADPDVKDGKPDIGAVEFLK